MLLSEVAINVQSSSHFTLLLQIHTLMKYSCDTSTQKHWPSYTLLLLGVILAAIGWGMHQHQAKQRNAAQLLSEQMRLPDTLRVVTLSGSSTYFRYRDEGMGYQWELVRLFAQAHELPIDLYIARDIEEIHALLDSGRVDLSITPEAVTQSGKKLYQYVGLEVLSPLVLVQHKSKSKEDSAYIARVPELLGRSISVIAGSRGEKRLLNLQEQLGGSIDIRRVQSDSINSEELIEQVDRGEIAYTIADGNLAKIARPYYRNIDVSLEIGFEQRLRWVTTHEHRGLAEKLNLWADTISLGNEYRDIHKRYFEMQRIGQDLEDLDLPTTRSAHTVPTTPSGALSPYDALFRKEITRLGDGWSWQILASIAWQESNFIADIVGWSGARGLMGIMPNTGKIFGASKAELLEPATSVRVSVDCLKATEAAFKDVPDLDQRVKMTLAGYNAGLAHVQDARRLAAKYGSDPNRWDEHVEKYILLKSEPKYYTDPVCKYGYLRGKETYKYVREVTSRAEAYAAKVQ